MARMAKAEWSANRDGKRDAESACRPATAVIIALSAEALELYRPKPVRADQRLIFDGDECRQVWPAFQLLPEHVPCEVSRCSVILGPVALGAA